MRNKERKGRRKTMRKANRTPARMKGGKERDKIGVKGLKGGRI